MTERPHTAHAVRRCALHRKAQRRHTHFYARCTHWELARHAAAEPLHWRRERWILGITVALIALMSGLVLPKWARAMRQAPAATPHVLLPLSLPRFANTPGSAAIEAWQAVEVRPGQTLADIFQSRGLPLTDLQHVLDAAGDAKAALSNIHPGERFEFLIANDGTLRGMRFDKDVANRVTLRFEGDQVRLSLQAHDLDRREHVAHANIQSSLFAAAKQAGMSEAMVIKLADLFKYDIDFAQDLREVDNFTVIYDDIYRDGTYYDEGDIVAAEFINQGTRYTAYRFKKSDGSYGWFSEDGRPIQKSFLRIPVDFARISSTFSAARLHPILGRMRAHKGVDYAAPSGTPIHAAGDGVVTSKAWSSGYGNLVLIQHNGGISTAYGHLSRFGQIRVGSRVRQGEIIGYVGMTGLATGPHLHYEFRLNNTQRDPQTVTLPQPEPLPGTELARFKREVVAPQLTRLQVLSNSIRLAKAEARRHRDD